MYRHLNRITRLVRISRGRRFVPGGPFVNPTISLSNTAEGGSDGTTVTTGNSGGGSGDAFTAVGGTPQFSNAVVKRGSLAYRNASAPTGGPHYGEWSHSAAGTIYGRAYFYLASIPAAGTCTLVVFQSLKRDGTGLSNADTISISAAPGRKVRLNSIDSAASPGSGAWFRVEWKWSTDPATSQHTVTVRTFMTDPEGATWDDELVDTFQDSGEPRYQGAIRIGMPTSGSGNWQMYWDDLALSTTTWLGATGTPAHPHHSAGALVGASLPSSGAVSYGAGDL